MIYKFYQWTNKGLVLAGRKLNNTVLEAYRPDGLLENIPPVLFNLSENCEITLEPINKLQPSVFVFKRNNKEHIISIKDGHATIDGSLLTLDELALLVELGERGEAKITYPIKETSLIKNEVEETYHDPITGAESLTSLITSQAPYLYVGVYNYKDHWEQSPLEAQDLCKILVDHILKVGSCIRLVGGSFVSEIEDHQQGLEIAVKMIHELNETVAGKSSQLKVGFEISDQALSNWTPKDIGLSLPDGRSIR